MLLTLFARKEPTVDPVALSLGLSHKKDVVFYKDEACTQRYCIWSWYLTPLRKTRQTVTLNCWPWSIKWLEDLPAAVAKPQTAEA